MEQNFSFVRRNPGHWDVVANNGRIFAIRGGPGAYFIREEQGQYHVHKGFKTLQTALSFVIEHLTYELIVADGQQVTVIESWNV